MTHAFASRRRDASDETHNRLLHVGFAPARGFRLVGSTNFTDHDHRVSFGVVVEHAHDVDVFEAVDRVAANADGT
jgi:hypothetical protein